MVPLALALVALVAICNMTCTVFVPAPLTAARAARQTAVQPAELGQAAFTAALAAAATAPAPALALDEDEDLFDIRILAVLALPLGAVSWALFNVWRVAFRQVVRIGESASGSSKIGLRPED